LFMPAIAVGVSARPGPRMRRTREQVTAAEQRAERPSPESVMEGCGSRSERSDFPHMPKEGKEKNTN
jgi:hypothetical protein